MTVFFILFLNSTFNFSMKSKYDLKILNYLLSSYTIQLLRVRTKRRSLPHALAGNKTRMPGQIRNSSSRSRGGSVFLLTCRRERRLAAFGWHPGATVVLSFSPPQDNIEWERVDQARPLHCSTTHEVVLTLQTVLPTKKRRQTHNLSRGYTSLNYGDACVFQRKPKLGLVLAVE